MAAQYLGSDIYLEDEETVTRIFVNPGGGLVFKVELNPQEAQRLFEQLGRRRVPSPSKDKSLMEILEVDQWTSTGSIAGRDWAELKQAGIASVTGGDSAAARVIFGGRFTFREVLEHHTPSIGSVWFRRDADGRAEIWKTNYDSSG